MFQDRLVIPRSRAAERYEARLAAQNIKGENYPRASAGSTLILTNQILYLMALDFLQGDVVTNLLFKVFAAGSGATNLCKVGILDKVGNPLKGSADLGASVFAATGPRTAPLLSQWTCPSTDGYWAAIVGNGGTQPTIYRAGTGIGEGAFTGASMGAAAVVAGASTDFPAVQVVPAYGTSQNEFWVGWN